MRLTTVILLASLLHVSAAGLAQKITMSKTGASLKNVLRELKTQSGYNFLCAESMFRQAKPVDIDVKAADLQEVLKQIFNNQPLSYTINETTITIKEKEPSFINKVIARFQTIDVTGKVVDENGQPIAGASVLLKTTGNGTITMANGSFILKGIGEGEKLIFKFLGFESQELQAKKEMGLIRLKQSNSPLDEVKVVAYGTTSNRLTVGNSGGIKAENIEKHPVQNVLLALQGQVAGIDIQSANGVPGAGLKVRLQGVNSMANGSDPFYVIDGVPYISQLSKLGLNSGILGISSSIGKSSGTDAPGNPLNYLNPMDIESIEVLKDASATAIYGSRASNGAILITTKKGKMGRMQVELELQNGWSSVANHVDILNSDQYIQMRMEAFKNTGLAMNNDNAYDIRGLYGYDISRSKDWQKELLGKTAQFFRPQINISGGSANTQYLIGLGYTKQTTITPGDFSDRNGSLHLNLNSNSNDQRFKVQLNFNAMVDDNRLQTADLSSFALALSPTSPELYNPDGSINWALNTAGNTTWLSNNHPLAILQGRYRDRTTNLISNLVFSYNLAKGFDVKLNSGYTYLQSNQIQKSPLTMYSPERRPLLQRSANYVDSKISSYLLEPQLSYRKTSDVGTFNVLMGTTWQQNNRYSQRLDGRGYLSDELMEDIKSASTVTVPQPTINSVYKYNALFGRLNYNLKEKYLLEISGRRDGSSRFGSENRFNNFWALGGGWIFSEERFLKEKLGFISFGKLKMSYGTTGNDQISDYSWLDLYSVNSGAILYQNTPSLGVDQLSNPFLQWEETKKINFGVDLGFFKDKILFSVNYAINRSSNQLLSYNLPITTGFTQISSNLNATVENKVWEFSTNIKAFNQPNFSWNINANFTVPKNKLVAFDNLENSSYANTFFIGKPVDVIPLFHFLGVNPANGKYLFADVNGNPTETPDSFVDKTVFKSTQLRYWLGGFNNSFNYKGIQLDINLNFAKISRANFPFAPSGNNPGFLRYNQPTSVLDRWQSPGQNASSMLYSTSVISTINYSESDARFLDDYFVRLKNMSVSYVFPDKWLKKKGLSKVRLSANGENLGVWSKNKNYGFDPETGLAIPPLRTITVGFRAAF